MASENQYGLIILGNSGVGKSFLANILLGHEAFAHNVSARSVTHITEYEEMVLGHSTVAVFNIPGLIEAEQERIDLNKKEIDKAFALRPISIVMFVFGQQGGRIFDEDVVAFNAINAAYPFQPKSLMLVVNGLRKNRPSNYEGSTLVLLQQVLQGVDVNNNNLCFLDFIDGNDLRERQHLKEKLLQVVVECIPSEHKKKQEIETLIDKLKESKQQTQQLQTQMVVEQEKYKKEIEENQRIFNQPVAKHRTEIESLQRAIQRQDELYAEQQCLYDEENRKYQAELQELRRQAEEAQHYHEKLRRDREISQQQLQVAAEEKQRAQAILQALMNLPPSPKKKEYWWQKLFQTVPLVNRIFESKSNNEKTGLEVQAGGDQTQQLKSLRNSVISDDKTTNTGSRKPVNIVNFRLNKDNQTINNVELSTNLTFRTCFQNPDENQNIIILYFDVELPDTNIFSDYNIQSYDNPFKFIADTLSIKDKTIYLIISTNKIHSIIPIIHKHYCIETIYLYGSSNTKFSSSWSSMSEKIDGCFLDIKEICDRIVKDIEEKKKTQLRWDRSFDLFTMLYTQRLENQYSVFDVATDISNDEYIVIFHCSDQKLFHTDQKSVPIREFTDTKECAQFIDQQTQSQIFLVISGSVVPSEMQSIFDSRQIHAIYFFRHNEFKYSTDKRKVNGLFDKPEDLSKQLHKDILFYRKQHIHTARLDVFSSIEETQKLLPQLSDKQIAFLTYNLFIDMLPQAPLLAYQEEDLIKICNLLFPGQGEKTAQYVNQLHEEIDELRNLNQDPRFSQIISRLHQLSQLNELFILQKPLTNISKRVFEPIDIFTTDALYLTRMISNNTLETIRSSCSEFVSIGIFILATKSLLTARTIARKVADNGLISILFQIEVLEGTRLLEIDSDRVIFPLDSLFRLESINQAPDGVYYVNIKPADLEFQLIKQQLQFESEVPLSWLTYGNYLCFLKQSQQGKTYFEYLLEKLPSEHIDRPAIYNNMALIYTMENEKRKAEKIYNDALNYAQTDKSDSAISESKDRTRIAIPTATTTSPKTSIDRSTVFGSVADVYYQKGDYQLALDYYKQALELSTDLNCRSYYQQMIVTIYLLIVWLTMVKATYKQTFIAIWLHDNNLSSKQQDKMKLYLNRTFYYYQIFVNPKEFTEYIAKGRFVTKIFLILSISNSSLFSYVNYDQEHPQLFEKVYVFLPTKNLRVSCFNTADIDALFELINQDIQDSPNKRKSSNHINSEIHTEPRSLNTGLIERPPPSLSVFNSKCHQITPIRLLPKESLHFLCFLTMANILQQISSYSREELSEMWTTCRKIYEKNDAQLDLIDKLEETYKACEAIKHYTGNSCLSRTVNQACHTENIQQIFTFRVYISDLHRQLVEYHEKDEENDLSSLIKMIYRGKPLSGSVLQQLIDNEGSLISMNGFLSTTMIDNVASFYHGDDQVSKVNKGYKPVLFVFTINTSIKQPYAYIAGCSTKPHEAEVLFALGTIWRIKSVQINEDLCTVELTSCDELDSQLTELLQKHTENGCDLSSVGDILFALGDDKEAEWFYEKMVKQGSLDNKSRGILYYKIGMIRFEREDYSIALEKFEKAVPFFPATINATNKISTPLPLYICDRQSPLIAIYNNMGLIHEETGNYEMAFNCYQDALKLPNGSRSEVGTVHNNLGLLYYHRGNYQEAREHHMKAIELIDESHSKWVKFKNNLYRTNQRCQHLADNNLNNQMQRTTIDE